MVFNERNIGKPLTPRSLALSVLLGSHPPVLPARAFMRLADEFTIAPGTMRTALSRLVTAGELRLEGGRYRLNAQLESRQHSQDIARTELADDWAGSWHTIVTLESQRSQPVRRRFRTAMTNAHFGVLRPDIWMRPANLPTVDSNGGWMTTTGPIGGVDPAGLVRCLWPIAELRHHAHELLDNLERVRASPENTSIAAMFTTAAATLRFLRRDPLLPKPLMPDDWPMTELRQSYAHVEEVLQMRLRRLFEAEQ